MFCCLSKDIDYGFFDFMSCSLHNLQSLSVHIFFREKMKEGRPQMSLIRGCVFACKGKPAKGRSVGFSAWLWHVNLMSNILEQLLLFPAYLVQTSKHKHLLVISLRLFISSREIFFSLLAGLGVECQNKPDSGVLETDGRRGLEVSQFIFTLNPLVLAGLLTPHLTYIWPPWHQSPSGLSWEKEGKSPGYREWRWGLRSLFASYIGFPSTSQRWTSPLSHSPWHLVPPIPDPLWVTVEEISLLLTGTFPHPWVWRFAIPPLC